MRRRTALILAGGAGTAALGVGLWRARRPPRAPNEPDGQFRQLTLAWPAPEHDPVVIVAREKGFFAAYDLDITMMPVTTGNEAIAALENGTAVGAAAPALSFLPRLHDGLKARIVEGLSAGSFRLLVRIAPGVGKIDYVVGKVIAVVNEDAADRRFFSVLLRRKGINPDDVHWKAVPESQIAAALAAGEVDGLVAHDPVAWRLLSGSGGTLTELAGSTTGHLAERVNRLLGLSETFLQQDPKGAVALVLAFRDACRWIEANRKEIAPLLAPHLPDMDEKATQEMLAHEPKPVHLLGHWLREQLAQYADELKLLDLLPDELDSGKFAQTISYDARHL